MVHANPQPAAVGTLPDIVTVSTAISHVGSECQAGNRWADDIARDGSTEPTNPTRMHNNNIFRALGCSSESCSVFSTGESDAFDELLTSSVGATFEDPVMGCEDKRVCRVRTG